MTLPQCELPGKATFLWSEQDQPSVGRTVDDDASLFTIHFAVADSDCDAHVSIGDSPTDFKFAPGAGGSVEAFDSRFDHHWGRWILGR